MKRAIRKSSFDYAGLLGEVKSRIQHAQSRAVLAANAEMVRLYWDIGRLIDARQKEEGYGTGVIPRLARDLHNELPELKGFSERNIGRMIAFHRANPRPAEVLPQAVAKPRGLPSEQELPQAVAKVPQPVAKAESSLLPARALPRELQSSLPTIDAIEAKLAQPTTPSRPGNRPKKRSAAKKVASPKGKTTKRKGGRR